MLFFIENAQPDFRDVQISMHKCDVTCNIETGLVVDNESEPTILEVGVSDSMTLLFRRH